MQEFPKPAVLQHSIHTEDPNLDHIPRTLYKSTLYEPSDDSYLFMEAIERDLNTLRVLFSMGLTFPDDNSSDSLSSSSPQPLSPSTPIMIGTSSPRVLELGPGTGILSSFTAKLLSTAPLLTSTLLEAPTNTTTIPSHHIKSHPRAANDVNDLDDNDDNDQRYGSGGIFPIFSHPTQSFSPEIIALDINPVAVEITTETFQLNNPTTPYQVYQSDLLSALPPQYFSNIDILLFNPPYVPSEEYEHQNRHQDDMIMNAYAGGAEGRAILDQLIPSIHSLFPNPPTPNIIRPFVFYCVFLWPVNNITTLNQMMERSSPPQLTQHREPRWHSHIIMARQCGLEALAIIRFIPNHVYIGLPDPLKGIYPVADEDNLRAIFKPCLTPLVITHPSAIPSSEADSQTYLGTGWSKNITNCIDSDGSDANDEDDENGFSLF